MSRKSIPNYTGARGRIAVGEAAKLDWRRHVIQPKMDGCYVHVFLDENGRVSRVLSRTGAPVASDLAGVLAGTPNSVLAGEMEAHTEAGAAAAKARGWLNIHLFDCIIAGGRSLLKEPYRVRRDELWRMQSWLTCELDSLSVRPDASGRYHDGGGRFRPKPTPLDWRRFPIVPSLRPSAADDLWSRAESGQIEGFVAVSLDAPVSRRNAKRKCKPVQTLDCVVVRDTKGTAEVRSFGLPGFFVPSHGLSLRPGSVVEIQHNGHYADGTPRFARIIRRRLDLESGRGARKATSTCSMK